MIERVEKDHLMPDLHRLRHDRDVAPDRMV
jgi:hypothetical protein